MRGFLFKLPWCLAILTICCIQPLRANTYIHVNGLCNVTVCESMYGGTCMNYSCDNYGYCNCQQCPHLKTGPCCESDVTNCSQGVNPCGLHGTCINNSIGFTCDCDSHWTGSYCQHRIQYCNCIHGTCNEDGMTCNCDPMYTGQTCNTLMCIDGYCLNGGTCSVTIGGELQCNCPLYYTSNRCEEGVCVCDADTCQSVPKTACLELGNLDHKCTCPGDNCSNINCGSDPCSCHPCQNGGTCITDISGYTCDCPPGLHCHHCELDKVDGCSPNPCVNGGTCVDGLGYDYTCICPPQYTGTNCSQEILICPLLDSNICTNCSEVYLTNVHCLSCPYICNCSNPSCQPNYCTDETAKCNPKGVEYVSCPYNLSNITIKLSCDCLIPTKLTPSMVGTVSDISTVSLSISSITTIHQTSSYSMISIVSSTTESSYPSPTLDPVCELPCELSNNSECICPRFPVTVLIIVVIACVAFVLAFLCVFILVVTGILRYFYRTSNKNGDGFSVRFKKKDES